MTDDSHKFDATVYEWTAQASWFFVALPEDLSDDLKFTYGARAAGFGSLKVDVTCGPVTWQTSVFPDKDRGVYVLPLKKAVRKANDLEAGSVATITLRVVTA